MLVENPCGCIFESMAPATNYWLDHISIDTYWSDAATIFHCVKCGAMFTDCGKVLEKGYRPGGVVLKEGNLETSIELFNDAMNIDAHKKESEGQMKQGEWRDVEDEFPEDSESVLFTNNIEGRTNPGHMSHVWIGHIRRQDDGSVKGFSEEYRTIHQVTHWLRIPMPEEAEGKV